MSHPGRGHSRTLGFRLTILNALDYSFTMTAGGGRREFHDLRALSLVDGDRRSLLLDKGGFRPSPSPAALPPALDLDSDPTTFE